MKKNLVSKIISKVIVFTFVIFFLQAFLPMQAHGANELNWDNPNKSGNNNPYKFKISDVVNSQMIMQVVGCTGVVDKVAGAVTNFAKQEINEFLTTGSLKDTQRRVCTLGKKLLVAGASVVPYLSTVEVPKLLECKEIQETESVPADSKKLTEMEQIAADNKKRDECFNGIAVTLAKNQLTAMTRNTLNWVNSGFNGNPMYVRDITSFTNNLEKNVLETGINILATDTKAYPYAADFSRSAITGYQNNSSFRNGGSNFLNSLTSDLSNFITDPNSYYSEKALDRANNANDVFANDFATGGWDALNALTQKDQNNPLGFTIQASEYLQDQQIAQTQKTKDELLTNNGFLDQKKCILWELYDNTGKPIQNENKSGLQTVYQIKTSPNKSSTTPNFDKCSKYETVTPGSIIKDKISEYANSPERQLELVKTINDSLNSLFSSLISKLQNEGLSSLSSGEYTYSDPNMGQGYGTNSASSTDNSTGGDSINTGGGYVNGSFDLTRDLGNTFIHTYSNKGSVRWDALNNIPELKMGVAPVDSKGRSLLYNVYIIVKVAGKTKIVENGYNNWEVGDRAFWNASTQQWQNWKKDVVDKNGVLIKTSPIDKRGVIQIQKDYVVAAKELLMTLPTIMPKLGELDYCIPGPNPNWQISSGVAESAFTALVGAATKQQTTKKVCPADHWYVHYISISANECWATPWGTPHAKLTVNDKLYVALPQAGKPEYDDYFSIFKNTMYSWWNEIIESNYWREFNTGDPEDRVRFPLPSHGEDKDQAVIDVYIKEINTGISVFNKTYSKYISDIFGPSGIMQKQYLVHEDRLLDTTQDKNPAYLPMASAGLDITKDITSYDDTITKSTNDYKDSIVKASANIDKLTLIEKDVRAIIAAAQARRDAHLLDILKGTDYASMTPAAAKSAYMAKYKKCFSEEYISYTNDIQVTDNGNGGERCNDNMDNDFDGLVDARDPDCHVGGVLSGALIN